MAEWHSVHREQQVAWWQEKEVNLYILLLSIFIVSLPAVTVDVFYLVYWEKENRVSIQMILKYNAAKEPSEQCIVSNLEKNFMMEGLPVKVSIAKITAN